MSRHTGQEVFSGALRRAPRPAGVVSWDDLFAPLARSKRLPMGYLTSQFFANCSTRPSASLTAGSGVHPERVEENKLGFGACARYSDDMIVFGESAQELAGMRTAIEGFLSGMRLNLHPGKSAISLTEDGVRFQGFRVFAGHRRVTHGGKRRQERRIGELQREFRWKRIAMDRVTSLMASMRGELRSQRRRRNWTQASGADWCSIRR